MNKQQNCRKEKLNPRSQNLKTYLVAVFHTNFLNF